MPPEVFQSYLEQLPPLIQKKVLRFKHWEDAERTLAGNILLLKGLQLLNITNLQLAQLKYTEFQKPYFDENVHFNISHSGKYTICAISQTNQVGIDVEEINAIPLGDFTELFYEEEWQRVLNSQDSLKAFYTLWTKKESFLKVIGSGLNVPLNKVIIENDRISWENSIWVLQEVQIDTTHVCYICTSEPIPLFKVTGMHL
ncbi:MAG: 4-phosphopantetheinyl transferase [Ferruginibacter sp.]|nr:4-phosphopantetheinyl transferase [Ferruginibacter sp.]